MTRQAETLHVFDHALDPRNNRITPAIKLWHRGGWSEIPMGGGMYAFDDRTQLTPKICVLVCAQPAFDVVPQFAGQTILKNVVPVNEAAAEIDKEVLRRPGTQPIQYRLHRGLPPQKLLLVSEQWSLDRRCDPQYDLRMSIKLDAVARIELSGFDQLARLRTRRTAKRLPAQSIKL